MAPPPAEGANRHQPTRTDNEATDLPARSVRARSSSPIPTGGAQAPASAGYRLATRLNPGRGSISGVA